MAANNSAYWEKRIAAGTWKTYNSLEEKNRDLLEFYTDASEQIKKELYLIAEKYSKDGVLSLSDMHKKNRLTDLNQKFQDIIEDLGHKTEKSAKKNMQDGFKAVYENTAVGMGDEDFSMPNKKLMEKLLNEPWRGDSFSGRLWKNQKKLAVGLNDLLLTGLQQGKTATEIAVSLHNFMGQGFNECHRLVRTEAMHYLNGAAQLRYKDAGVEYVQVWAAEDERTCKDCGDEHENIYPIDKCPHVPFHPNCRCTIIPCFDEKLIAEYERKHGKTKDKKAASGSGRVPKKPVNKFGEEIIFDDSMSDARWDKNKDMIRRLAAEYDTRLTTVSSGSRKKSGAAGTVDLAGNMVLSSRQISTTIHEFAHSISMSKLEKYGLADDGEFWKEIKKIRTKYRKAYAKGEAKSISGYADSELDEFFAESFALAKMHELGMEIPYGFGSDVTYSQQILDTVDKYFKKSVVKDGDSDIIKRKENRLKINLQFFAESDIKKQESNSLKRAIRKYEKRIKEHEDYLEHPETHCSDWDEKSRWEQEGLKKHWKKEIRNFNQSIQDRIDELKARGDYDD